MKEHTHKYDPINFRANLSVKHMHNHSFLNKSINNEFFTQQLIYAFKKTMNEQNYESIKQYSSLKAIICHEH
jgi:hypothetical protein